MKIRSLPLFAAALFLVSCDALTAHVDVAAKAESNELSATRLSDLMGNSPLQIPLNKETASLVAELWVNYQLMGVAGARGDSLSDTKAIDAAAIGATSSERVRRYLQNVIPTLAVASPSEATYNQAEAGVLAARHILFDFPGGASQQQRDSVHRVAEGIRARATPSNFADLARRYSKDPGSGRNGGNLGVFERRQMVKEFGDGVVSTRPGSVSGLVESQFGYHIIYRPTYASARTEYDSAFVAAARQRAESTYLAGIDVSADVSLKSNAATNAKNALRDIAAHRTDDADLATFRGGDLTVAEFIRWIEATIPPQYQIAERIQTAPDSVVKPFIEGMARNEILLLKADSAGIQVGEEERTQLYAAFRGMVLTMWDQLGVDPASLADSARTVPEREKLAAARVNAYVDRMLAGQVQPQPVPVPVQSVLHQKYNWKINSAGIDRAVERASKLRASADSARSTQAPPQSQVPLPVPPADSP